MSGLSAVDPTWVMPEPGWVCPECGFDYESYTPTSTPEAIGRFGRRYRIPLTRGLPAEDLGALLRHRPPTGGWSALEYACHVRDAFTLIDGRVAAVLSEDRPSFPKLGRDQAAIDRDYNGQDPAVVADQLAAAADALAGRLESVPSDGWAQVGIRDDRELSVDWLARNAVHEGDHHLLDVARVLRAARRSEV